MRTLKRNKITIYLAKHDKTAETDYMQFATPIEVKVNFQGVSAIEGIEEFGEQYTDIRRSNVGLDLEDTFHENDRVYLSNPDPFSVLATDADYKVRSVVPSINGYVVTYEKLSGVDA